MVKHNQARFEIPELNVQDPITFQKVGSPKTTRAQTK